MNSERSRPAAAPGRAVRIAGWIVIAATPILVLGGLEVAARLLDLRPIESRGAEIPAWLDRNILVKESRWIDLLSRSPRDLRGYYATYAWDRYLFYRLRPGLAIPLTDITAPAAIRDRTRWVFHTNARGFNTPDFRPEKPEGTYRVVALGDSSTFGWGVDTDDAYPHVLAALLKRRHPGAPIEVVNLGVCGYSSLQGLVLLEREALAYEPDLVTLSYGSNDYSLVPEPFDDVYARNLGWQGAAQAMLARSRAWLYYASLLRGMTGRVAGGRTAEAGEARAAGQGDAGAAGQDGRVLNVGPEASARNLIAMVNLARRRGADALLVSNCVPGDMSAPIREAAAASRAPLLDTAALLEAAAGEVIGGRLDPEILGRYRALYGEAMLGDYPWLAVYLTDQCHPNVIGHRLIAGDLAWMVEASPSFQAFLARGRSGG